jgi:enoyl-[acyl-carrier-protein] reductase (NADH)
VAAERGVPFATVWEEYSQRNSLGRLPTAREIAWAVTLLLEPEAEVMHGGVLHLDGGGLSGID